MIYIFGGTSDSVDICKELDINKTPYIVSVATEAGREMCHTLKGKILVQRLNMQEMVVFLSQSKVSRVIDATHPFAVEVSHNIKSACELLNIALQIATRPSQIDLINHDLLIKVNTIEDACTAVQKLGHCIFLTTGSKSLAQYIHHLPNKRIIARVLPTSEVIESCYQLGLGVADIVALKGPFSQAMNRAMYDFYNVDVVITKESGLEGGYTDKVLPCLEKNIPCIVIRRPQGVTI